jgi:hypothetical protein
VFLVLVAKAMAPVWKVKRSAGGVIVNIERKIELVNHYSFHIIDPEWGHVTIKMSGHRLREAFGATKPGGMVHGSRRRSRPGRAVPWWDVDWPTEASYIRLYRPI